MKLHAIKPYFVFTRSQRLGILMLLSLIITLQTVYYSVNFSPKKTDDPEEQKWLALQHQMDSLKVERQNQKPVINPFNPNFITDFKGYRLGMSVGEIDRLIEFRKGNKYVNSAAEFQAVTKVSDSLLAAISPYFKFPDWVKSSQQKSIKNFSDKKEASKIIVKDINQATKEQLMKVYGIGPALSERIIKHKDLLGAFVSMEQMQDVWGLSPEVIAELNKHFNVQSVATVRRIRINDASLKELTQFPYFRYSLAKQI
ncbi:MAG TPA: helix-hairpin-helix domain-containing protein, partial [Flavobacterium sp.]|nr:helix-hairpin-helix domain-containing protein [Flavobacterium sp.]